MPMLRYQGAVSVSGRSKRRATCRRDRSGSRPRASTRSPVRPAGTARRTTTRSSPPSSRAMATSPDAPPATNASDPVSGVTSRCRPSSAPATTLMQQGGDRDGHHDRPVGAQRVDRVLLDHRADVDAEHALGGHARRPGYPAGSQRHQGQHDPDGQRGEQRRGRDADAGSSGTVTAAVTARSSAHLSIRRTFSTMITSISLSFLDRN